MGLSRGAQNTAPAVSGKGDARSRRAEPGCLVGFEPLLGDELRVVAAPCLRVVALGHDVRGFLSAVDRDEAPDVPEARPSLLAVSRVAYRPVLTDLAPWQQRALASCGCPRTVVALAEEVAAASGEDRGAALADLLLWLPTAEGLGMVSLTRNGPAGGALRRSLPWRTCTSWKRLGS
jgi:hypothetical protein